MIPKSLKAKRDKKTPNYVHEINGGEFVPDEVKIAIYKIAFNAGVAAALESSELQGLVTVLVHLQDEFKSFPDRSGGYYGCPCKDDLEEILEHCDEKYNRYDVIDTALEQWAQFRGSDD